MLTADEARNVAEEHHNDACLDNHTIESCAVVILADQMARLIEENSRLREQVSSDGFAARLIAPAAYGIPTCKSFHPGPDPKKDPMGWDTLCGRRGDRSIRPDWNVVTCVACLRLGIDAPRVVEASTSPSE